MPPQARHREPATVRYRTCRPGAGWPFAITLCALLVFGGTAPAAADTGPAPLADPREVAAVVYERPVGGDVLQRFAPPASPWGPGHRGVDLAVSAVAPVGAAADGRVVFAGPVAGTTWLSVAHADGVTTSYGPLGSLRVGHGTRVARGQVLGTSARGPHGAGATDTGLHWSARVGSRYLDPLSLVGAGPPRPSLIGAGAWTGTAHAVTPYAPWDGGRAAGLMTASSPVADRPGYAVAPNPNHLLLVPGLASDSATVLFDPEHLGYDPRSVTRFSYAGRDERGSGASDDPRRDQRPQTAADTWGGTERAALRLATQLRAQARREPGRAVDLIGHSMGGVTILRYLVEHHDPYDLTLPPIGHVVTIASPLHGSDLASIGGAIGRVPGFGAAIREQQRRGRLGGDHLPLDAPAIAELSVGSDMLWQLAVDWERTLEAGYAGALATGTRVLNIGGSRDLVVSADRTTQPDTSGHAGAPRETPLRDASGRLQVPAGAGPPRGRTAVLDGERVVDHRVLPGGHTSVLQTEALREVTWRFLAGAEVVDSPGHLSRVVGGELADTARRAAELVALPGRLVGGLAGGTSPNVVGTASVEARATLLRNGSVGTIDPSFHHLIPHAR